MITAVTVMHARNDMDDARAEYHRALADMKLMELELMQARQQFYQTSMKYTNLELAYKNQYKK